MPETMLNGVSLFWESQGAGAPVVLVHGSWVDHRSWDGVAPDLAGFGRLVRYDRRGHSLSGSGDGQGSVDEDVADLGALITALRLAPAHIVGSSFGGSITLRLAAVRPELFATLVVHEPPLLGLIRDDSTVAAREQAGVVAAMLQAGDIEGGARQFVETVALGPGMWKRLPPNVRRTFVDNALTWLDEMREPAAFMIDVARLAAFDRPALLMGGGQSPPFFAVLLRQLAGILPRAQQHVFAEAGHVPHLTHPADYTRVVLAFLRASAGAGPRNSTG